MFANPGAAHSLLKAAEVKTVILKLKPGKDFSAEDVRKARDAVIHIEARANGTQSAVCRTNSIQSYRACPIVAAGLWPCSVGTSAPSDRHKKRER